MSLKIAAVAVLAALFVTPAFAQSAAPAAVPATTYVSPCKAPNLEPYPTIPDAATAKIADVNKAKAAFTAWSATNKVYFDCKKNEFATIDAEVAAVKAKSPAAVEAGKYEALMAAYNKTADALKGAGGAAKLEDVTLVKAGKPCPTAPAMPPPISDPKAVDKKAVATAQKEFNTWGKPIYIYLECEGKLLNASITASNSELAPVMAKNEVARSEYNDFVVKVQAFNLKWNAFVKAYNARVTGGAH